MTLDNNNDEGYVLDVAHECGHTFVTCPALAGGKEGCMSSTSSMAHHQAEPMNSASAATSHSFDIVRQINDRASSREVHQQGMHPRDGPMDYTLVHHGMKSEVPSFDAIDEDERHHDDDNSNNDNSLASDNDDDSVASDKSYYKGLCAQLTEALVTRKTENNEVKQENKALRKENKALKKENTDLNSRLSNTTDYKRETKRLKRENADLQEEILKCRSDNNEYKLKNKRLKKENKGLKEELAEISHNNYNHRRMEHHTTSSFSAKYA